MRTPPTARTPAPIEADPGPRRAEVKGFTENGLQDPGLLRLNVGGQSSAFVPSFVGARCQSKTVPGIGVISTPGVPVAYVHEAPSCERYSETGVDSIAFQWWNKAPR